jgi:phospholipase A1
MNLYGHFDFRYIVKNNYMTLRRQHIVGLIKCKSASGLGVLLLFIMALVSAAGPTWAQGTDAFMLECLSRVVLEAGDDATVGQLKAVCEAELLENQDAEHQVEKTAEKDGTALEQRLKNEKGSGRNLWTIMPHRPNYFLFVSQNFSSMNEGPWQEVAGESAELYQTEAKFQISFKFMLWEKLFKKDIDLYLAYTQLSLWQLYNKEISSPFRSSDYEPELFFTFANKWRILGFNNRLNAFGVSHQSNGRSEPLSRSWNRVWASFIFARENLAWGVKLWYRIPESEEDDDNPDIEDYLGYGHLRVVYKWGNNTFGVLWRNNLDFNENRGAVEVNWSFPLPGTDRIKGYLQYFNGYGQCLLDYNASSSTLGLGLLLTDWL